MVCRVSHYLLQYDYVEDIAERRGPYREAHLAALREERDAGRVVMAGALGDPPIGAAIVFKDVDAATVAAFAERDPYVVAGLVRGRRIDPYNVVV
jgi:hypothetical protein